MASTSFKKRNLNRFQKVYPFIRFEKRMIDTISDNIPILFETGIVSFNNASEGTYFFTESYSSVPPVVATAVDSLGNEEASVNVFVSSISTTSVTFGTSEAFSGQVHLQVISGTC